MSEEIMLKFKKKKRKYKRSVDTPVIIAFFIVLLSACALAVLQIFFDTSLKGSWRLRFKQGGQEYMYNLTLLDDNKFNYSFGGVTYDGEYIINPETSTLSLSSSSYGKYNLRNDFKYKVAGNIFTGKGIALTASDDTELPFLQTDSFVPVIKYYSDFTPNESILGSWLYVDEKQGYNYTFTFYDDGRYEYLCSGSRHIGAYKTTDNQFTYNLVVDGDVVNEETFEFSLDGDKLTFITDNFTDTLTKTNDKFSFENEIK